MTSEAMAERVGLRSRIARARLEIDSLALTGSAGITAILGVVFWAIAAHGYDAAEVGRGAAVISTATMLATLSNLSFGGMYQRFLRPAGARAVPLVVQGSLVCALLALVLGAGFAWLGPADRLFSSSWERLGFPLLVVALSNFALLDGILVGIQRATWAAAKNVVHAAVKAALAGALIVTASGYSLALAWTATALVLCLAWLPSVVRHLRTDPEYGAPPSLPPRRELTSYFASTYAITVLGALPPLAIPLIVVSRLGNEVNAYFTVAWTVFSAASLLLGTVVGPYIAAMAVPEGREYELTRRFALLAGGIAVAGAVFLWFLAPVLLHLFGREYSTQTQQLMRLMAFVLPLSVVGSIYAGLARAVRRLRLATLCQIVTTILLIGGAWICTGRYGLAGIGYLYLAVEAFVTVLFLGPTLRLLRQFAAQRAQRTAIDSPVRRGPAPMTAPTDAPTPTSPSAERARLSWVDALRGICILLVVFYHSPRALVVGGLDDSVWTFSVELATVRMPAFFLVSGLLSASALRAPWRRFLVRRPALYGYLYLLWCLVLLAAFTALAVVGSAAVRQTVTDQIHQSLYADGVLWYLAALGLYYLLARLTAGVPALLQILLALAVSELANFGVIATSSWGWDHMLQLYVFFLLGLHGRPYLLALTGRLRPVATLAATVLFALLWLAAIVVLPQLDSDMGLMFALAPWVGVPMLVGIALLVADRGRVGQRLRALGAATLPIYVLHTLVLALIGAVVSASGVRLDGLAPAAGLLLLLLTAAVTTVASVALGRLLTPRLPWLFALPTRRRKAASAKPTLNIG